MDTCVRGMQVLCTTLLSKGNECQLCRQDNGQHSNYRWAPTSKGKMFQDLPQLHETAGNTKHYIQDDQKVCSPYDYSTKNMQKYFKQFQSLTMITQLELGITDGVSVSLVSINVWRWARDTLNITCNFLIIIIRCKETFWSPCITRYSCNKHKYGKV
jgi:hypothetical protein